MVILAALVSGACASTYSEVQADWPAIPSGTGRVVFFGDNYGWYGVFEGVSWKPVIAIDGREFDVGHGTGVYFMAELPTGMRRIAVDGQEALAFFVEANTTKYVEMQRVAEVNDDFGLRKYNFKLELLRVDEAYAKARLDGLEFIGIVR